LERIANCGKKRWTVLNPAVTLPNDFQSVRLAIIVFETKPITVVKTLLLSIAIGLSASSMPCSVAAGAEPFDRGPLHDFYKTANPWFRSEKRIEEAKRTVAKSEASIKSDPKDIGSYINCASSYLLLMQPEAALKKADIALALKSENKELLANIHCVRGQALLQDKQYKEALDELNKACFFASDNGEAFYFRGMAKEKLEQLPGAITDYKLADNLGFVPKVVDVDYSAYMSKLQKRIRQFWFPPRELKSQKTAIAFKILRDGSVPVQKISKTSDVAAIDNAAMAAIKKAAPFEPLPKGAPKDIDIDFVFDFNSNVGESFLERSTAKWDSAQLDAERKLAAAEGRKDPAALIDAQLNLAKIYKQRGAYPSAIDLYKRALDLLQKSPEKNVIYGKTIGHLAMVYSLQGKPAEAETEFKKSLEILDKDSVASNDPEVVEILKEYAKVLYRASKSDEANKIYARLKK
jgi:TonB family protein